MKKMIISVVTIVILTGCSTAPPKPSTPNPDPQKYTFQVIGIEIPNEAFIICNNDIDKITTHPDAKISEYPIVVAGVGESVTNDQTRPAPSEIDGKPVDKDIIVKLGYSVSIQNPTVEGGALSYHLISHYEELVGFEEYTTQDGASVMMPFTTKRELNTQISQKLNTWITLGGLIKDNSDGKKTNLMLCVRTIPPTANKL